MLIAAATKAPDDPSHAAKLVWDNYYANHQKKGAFKHLKVADIFMGGGTTLVEGSRLGMQFTERASAKWLKILMAVVLYGVAVLRQELGCRIGG